MSECRRILGIPERKQDEKTSVFSSALTRNLTDSAPFGLDSLRFHSKKHLRRKMLQRRRALSEEQRTWASGEILRHLYQENAYCEARTVMAYAPMRDEVQLMPLLADCLRRGKRLAIPLIVGEGQMEAVGVPSLEALTEGTYGILTVREGERQIIPPPELDCVIVPGAAFSRKGERLGLGSGFYDRFLCRCPQAARIALAFSCQVVDELPTESHDLLMDMVITEQFLMKEIDKERIWSS